MDEDVEVEEILEINYDDAYDDVDEVEEADDAVEEDIRIDSDEVAIITETIEELQDIVDQPLTSMDGLDDSNILSSSLKLEAEPTEPVTNHDSTTGNRSSSTRKQTPRKRNKYVRRVHGPILLSDEEVGMYVCIYIHTHAPRQFILKGILYFFFKQ